MEALFLKLLNMSISASWLVLAVVVLRFAMKKAPKWMTCALWALVAIRLVFPFSIESMFSIVPSAQTLPPEILTNNHFEINSGIPVIDHQINDVVLDNYYEGVTVPNDMGFNFMSAAGTVWIIGLAALLVYALISYLLIRRKVSASMCLRENIYLCDYIESPFILGIIRPKIYLPSALDQGQWPHVIAHEKAHLARRDHWWKPLGFAILCVYWFNPVLWLAYILLCKDIELACDERVIRNMDTRQKQDYTTALLECSMPRYLIAACPLAFGEVGVKDRVKSVLNYKKPAFWIILISLLLCIAAAVCFLTDPVGEHSITPGIYDNTDTSFLQHNPDSQGDQSMAGQYILQDNTLYAKKGQEITALGRMTPYDLSMEELKGYFQKDQWNRLDFHNFASISEALWLRMEDGSFYVWFITSRSETYLACGVEDYGERYEGASDDTYITQLCRLTRDENAEEKELAWFDATVLEAQTTWLTVSPVDNTWMSSQYTQISVSRYWFAEDEEMCSMSILPGEFSVGDRVRIVYDSNVAETYPAQITKTYSITKMSGPASQYSVRSGDIEITPLQVPANTDISTLSGLPVLTLAQNDSKQYQFQLLLNGQPNPGRYRLYDYKTLEEIKNFDYLGNTNGPDWSLLEPGRNYIVVQERDGMLCFIASAPYDFGITLTGRNITPTGMTVTCTQSGGNCPGEITYGNPQGYWLRRITDYGWENVPNLDGTTGVVITTEAYVLERNSTATWTYNWTNRFGALEPGDYRFDLYFSHGESLENYTYLPFSVYFTIGDSQSTYEFTASVLDVNDGSILVEPLPGTANHPGTDRLWVRRTLVNSGEYVQDIHVGDIVSILYDGMIAETYPGQIDTVYEIQVLPEHTATATNPPGTYYRFKTHECLYLNPLSSQVAWDDNGRYYIFDNGLFQIVQRQTNEVLFQCSLEDSQWQEFPFTEERWTELLPDGYDDLSQLRERLWGAQYRQLSDNYCLFLKDGTLYVAYGFFDTEIAWEYFWDIFKLGLC